MIKVSFRNLGYIEDGEVEIKKLTILTGENNTGKTYVSYALYGLMQKLGNVTFRYILDALNNLDGTGVIVINLKDVLNKNLINTINTMSSEYTKSLSGIFSTSSETFKDSQIKLKIDKESFLTRLKEQSFESHRFSFASKDIRLEFTKEKDTYDVNIAYFNISNMDNDKFFFYFFAQEICTKIFNVIQNGIFLLPAERAGLNLFYKELNINRNRTVHELGTLKNEIKDEGKIIEYLNEKVSLYPKPISDYIDFLNKLEYYSKNLLTEFNDIVREIQSKIIGGKYLVDEKEIFFIPDNDKKMPNTKKMNLHISSSTVKTFFGLVFYIEKLAEKGDMLIIDEPELNLHPDNQRKIARIIAKLVNRGINVVISTHSDYIIKELNNLIMLNNNFNSKKELMSRYNYAQDELLDLNDISPYIFVNNTIKKMDINKYEGIIASSFDDVINEYNASADDIYYTLQEELDCEP